MLELWCLPANQTHFSFNNSFHRQKVQKMIVGLEKAIPEQSHAYFEPKILNQESLWDNLQPHYFTQLDSLLLPENLLYDLSKRSLSLLSLKYLRTPPPFC